MAINYSSPTYACDYNFGCIVKEQPNKEKEMDLKKPYTVLGDWSGKTYETEDEAIKVAKKLASEIKEDVGIRKIVSVVKFPIPDYEVEPVA